MPALDLTLLFTPLSRLKGVGPKMQEALHRLNLHTVRDLLFHLPAQLIDRREMPALSDAPHGETISAIVTIGKHQPPPRGSKRPYHIECHNDTGALTLVYFVSHAPYLAQQLPEGQQRLVSGRVEWFQHRLQMAHPEIIALPHQAKEVLTLEPQYPLTLGIGQRFLRKLFAQVLPSLEPVTEWADPALVQARGWPAWHKAITRVHHPQQVMDIDSLAPHRVRLAYDELLAHQLALRLMRRIASAEHGIAWGSAGSLQQQLLASLPFQLTAGQQQVIAEIQGDLTQHARMLRLLQGDVGSGKTIVGMCAMLHVVEAGAQAAFMAPTDLLCRQHAANMQRWLDAAGLADTIKIALLTGRDKGKKREAILAQLAAGEIQILIGTHALFQESIQFHKLGLVVIDEQHRFGVKQRLALAEKGIKTDMLLMTATPIPRTLTLTLYGDMAVSVLREKPPGRTPIDTRIIAQSREAEIIAGLSRAIAEGNRIYWVCPLIEEQQVQEDAEAKPLAAAEARYAALRGALGDRIGLVHGKMPNEKRDATMLAFKAGDLDVLVATTVIEVGVDVPEATIMVIEQAERFGLSQLHQLRGRVGRGGKKSVCMLLYGDALGETGKRRLTIMRETEDGFRIAEEDLAIRGGGDVLGVKQSGMPEFTLAQFPEHTELLFIARDDASALLAQDTNLATPRGFAARNLLQLFGYDAQAQLRFSG